MLGDLNETELSKYPQEQHPIHFRGRRRGRRLRPNLMNLINEELPNVRINRETPVQNPLDLYLNLLIVILHKMRLPVLSSSRRCDRSRV